MSRLFLLRGKMRLVKLGAQVVFRNYIDLASHDFLRLSDLGSFWDWDTERKKDRWMEEGGGKEYKILQYLYLCIVMATISEWGPSIYLPEMWGANLKLPNIYWAFNHQVKQRKSIRYFSEVCCLNMNPNLSLVYPNVRTWRILTFYWK